MMPDVIAIGIMFALLGATLWVYLSDVDRRNAERRWDDE